MKKLEHQGYKKKEMDNNTSNNFWDWLFNKIIENRNKNLTSFRNKKYFGENHQLNKHSLTDNL